MSGVDPAYSLSLAWAFLLATSAPAGILPLVNPSFEDTSRPLAIGEITNGAGGVGVPVGTRPNHFAGAQFASTVEVAGWRTYLPTPQNPTATIRAGVLRPHEVSPGVAYLTGYVGQHVVTSQNAAMQQTLPYQINPATRYRLTFLAAPGATGSLEGIYVSLLGAPDLTTLVFNGSTGTVLAQTQGLIPLPGSESQMREYALEVSTPPVLPANLQGRYLAVALVGSDGIPIMNFDEFRLEFLPVCPPDFTSTVVPGAPGYGVPNTVVTSDDFFYYLARYAAGDRVVADLTTTATPGSTGYGVPDGVLRSDDFFYYLTLYAEGC